VHNIPQDSHLLHLTIRACLRTCWAWITLYEHKMSICLCRWDENHNKLGVGEALLTRVGCGSRASCLVWLLTWVLRRSTKVKLLRIIVEVPGFNLDHYIGYSVEVFHVFFSVSPSKYWDCNCKKVSREAQSV
jgi:hypothetical protein